MHTRYVLVQAVVTDEISDHVLLGAIQESMTRFGWEKPEVTIVPDPAENRPEGWADIEVGIE